MSGGSLGSILGGVIGVALSPFTGGASLLVTSALMAGGRMLGDMIDPVKGPHQEGPRLNDLAQQISSYGAFLPRIYGKAAVFGNVFWIEKNKLKEVATTTTQGGKAGPPEASQTTYSYYGTFAVGLCEGLDPALYGAGAEMVLSKLWLGGKLWYNRASTDSETLEVTEGKEGKFKFYSGTETQMPDPRMEADLTVAKCPAFRGRCYIVFYDLPLAAYGNSIAGVQVKAELMTKSAYNLQVQALTPAVYTVGIYGAAFYNGYLYVSSPVPASLLGVFKVTETGVTQITTLSIPNANYAYSPDNGYLYLSTDNGQRIRIYSLATPESPSLVYNQIAGSAITAFAAKGNRMYVVDNNDKVLNLFDLSSPSLLNLITQETSGLSTLTSSRITNSVIYQNTLYVINSNIYIYDITNQNTLVFVQEFAITGQANNGVIKGNYLYLTGVSFIIQILDISNPLSPSLVYTLLNDSSGNWNVSKMGIAINTDYLHISTTTQGYRVYDIKNPVLPVQIYDTTLPFNFGLFLRIYNNRTYITSTATGTNTKIAIYKSTLLLSGQNTALGDIVQSEIKRSKLLTAADADTSQLTQIVKGYRVSSLSSIRSAIEPLQTAWPFDIIQDGYKLKAVKRGGASVATIPGTDLDARIVGAQPGKQIAISREMETVLPARVNIKYFDVKREYDTGEQGYERLATDAVNAIDRELSIVLDGPEAAKIAETLVYLYWLERYDVQFSLPPTYLNLQPSDIVTVATDDATYEIRIKQIDYTADGILTCQGKYNRAAIYSPAALGEEGPAPVDTLADPGITDAVFLDIPLLLDSYNVAGFPVAMTGTKSGWPGGLLYSSNDSGFTYDLDQAIAAPGTVIGTASNALATHPSTGFDKRSALTITLSSGELSSISLSALFAGGNHFAYGADGRWEIIAAQTCVLNVDGSYTLSDMLRGRYGTEHNTGNHVVGDRVVRLSTSGLAFAVLTSSQINVARFYKPINSGATLDSVSAQSFTYTGVNLKPLSPVHLGGSKWVSNDWQITWVRRGRVNAEWKDNIDVPLGEASESYAIEIYSSNTFTTLRRTLTSTSPQVIYTNANQITDFGATQTTIYIKIYQVSATVGRGYPLTGSLTSL